MHMNINRTLLAGLLAGAAVLNAAEPHFVEASKPSGDGDYLIGIEAPFAQEASNWLPLRISVKVKNGKPADAFATAMQLNVAWHPVDVSALTFADNAFSGEAKVAFRRDEYQVATAAIREKKTGQPSIDAFTGITPQAIKINCPVGTVMGTAPGEAVFEKDVFNNRVRKPTSTKVRISRDRSPDARNARYLELQIIRWAEDARAGCYDGMYGNASLLVRCAIRDGKSEGFIVLQGPERYALQYADLAWSVPAGALQWVGDTLAGELTLAPSEDASVRKGINSQNWHPLPAQSLQVKIEAKVIGSQIVGSAHIVNAGTTCESSLTGRVRSNPFARFADRTPRNWTYTAEPDPALVEAARKEALIPIRPGEPGKREFWSDWTRFGGCDFFFEDGKKIVQVDVGRQKQIFTYADYRANRIGKLSGAYQGITPPSFNLSPVPGAAKYRFTVKAARPNSKSLHSSAEVEAPWKPLTELWQKLPLVTTARGGDDREILTMEALDASGMTIGEPVVIPITRYPPFAGPYFKTPRTYRDAALMSARWLRDHPVNSFARVGVGLPGISGAGGDGQLWNTNFSAMYAGLVLAQLADDPVERAEALDVAIVTGDTWLRSFMANYLPDTYKGWVFDQWVYGTAWLDLYRLTGDPRYREAVMLHAKRLVDRQLDSGTWTDVEAANGTTMADPKTGRPFISSIQGPSMQQWDPSSVIYYLGRIRKELKTDDFRAAEDKTYRWLMDNSVARFDWRQQGPGESTMHKMPWNTRPDCALHFFNYLALDLPGRAPDWELMGELLRWSEDGDVDWRRVAHPTSVFPRSRVAHRGSQMRLAEAFAVYAQHTGDPLSKAKSEALAAACLIAQFPTTGQIPHFPDIDATLRPGFGFNGPGSGDGGNRSEYATMALMSMSKLLESK